MKDTEKREPALGPPSQGWGLERRLQGLSTPPNKFFGCPGLSLFRCAASGPHKGGPQASPFARCFQVDTPYRCWGEPSPSAAARPWCVHLWGHFPVRGALQLLICPLLCTVLLMLLLGFTSPLACFLGFVPKGPPSLHQPRGMPNLSTAGPLSPLYLFALKGEGGRGALPPQPCFFLLDGEI